MATEVGCAVPCSNTLGEGPVWDVSEGALYWADIQEGLLQRWVPGTDQVERWTMPERVGALALRADRGLVLALASGFALFDPATDSLERRAAPEAHLPGNRFNDGKCDARGRFWAGTMDDAALNLTGSLYRLDPDGGCSSMETGLGITNSLAWSPDNATFYFADTLRDTIFACDFDLESGTLANRHVFATTHEEPGSPDGSTVDQEGFLWNAQWGGSRLVRYAPDGRIDRVVDLPVSQPTSCMFGGPDLRTLYVTSAAIGLSQAERERQPWAGHVLALDVGVRGLPAARFAG